MKYRNINSIVLIIIALLSFFASCGHNHSEDDGHNHGEHNESDGHNHGEGEEHGEHEEGAISLTKVQIKTIDLQMGDLIEMKINDFVKATGTLELPPNAFSTVSARSAGFIKGCKSYIIGEKIKKGSLIAYLENPEFIQKQQEYLEVKAELVFLRQDLERHESLVKANAGVAKDFQKLQAEVAMKEARMKGLAKYISYLGIDTDKLTPDNLQSKISIIAPSSGYLAVINLHNGMYITPDMELIQIVDDKILLLELNVFEKDIANVKEGLKISYDIPALGDEQYEGQIQTIGKEFNLKNKTVKVYGQLKGMRPKFIKDLFITAKIWLNDQVVKAVPEDAVIKDGASSFIYIAKENDKSQDMDFQKIMVIPGTSESGKTAIKLIDEIPKGMKIVTKGAYYVYAQSKAGELTHEH